MSQTPDFVVLLPPALIIGKYRPRPVRSLRSLLVSRQAMSPPRPSWDASPLGGLCASKFARLWPPA